MRLSRRPSFCCARVAEESYDWRGTDWDSLVMMAICMRRWQFHGSDDARFFFIVVLDVNWLKLTVFGKKEVSGKEKLSHTAFLGLIETYASPNP